MAPETMRLFVRLVRAMRGTRSATTAVVTREWQSMRRMADGRDRPCRPSGPRGRRFKSCLPDSATARHRQDFAVTGVVFPGSVVRYVVRFAGARNGRGCRGPDGALRPTGAPKSVTPGADGADSAASGGAPEMLGRRQRSRRPGFPRKSRGTYGRAEHERCPASHLPRAHRRGDVGVLDGVGDVTVPTDFTTAPDEGGTFRWDPVEGQYVLNVQMRPLSVGTWELIVALDDGTAWSTYLGLK